VAGKVFGHLAKLAAVEDRAGKPEGGPTVYIFFDPRCPYCHAAFKALTQHSCHQPPLRIS
jgi:protein-disulfide isomerase